MNQNQEIHICDRCGCEIENDDYYVVDEDILCENCADEHCCRCAHCNDLIYQNDAVSDDDTILCEHCYDTHYTRCYDCGRLIRNDDSYYADDYDFCFNCYNKRHKSIREYSYKPSAVFFGEGKRYLGVELEVDVGGHDDDNAEELLNIANSPDERIYIKSDGSIDDGFEIVTHPMTLDYHMNEFCWPDILHRAVQMGYRSHQTSTCGLHVHVSRAGLGSSYEEQEETISRILYFVEQHWNELLKFSRRTEYTMNRWAARHGYEHDPKKILDKAKSQRNRYVAVNLCNSQTIEFRLFRGTLRLNTLLATLQLAERICTTAMNLSEYDLKALSWSEFVSKITEPELIQYLKERRLYINDIINTEEDM